MKKKMFLTAMIAACMLTCVCYFPVQEIALNVTLNTAADAHDDGWRYYPSSLSDDHYIRYAGQFTNGELYIPSSLYFESGNKTRTLYRPNNAGTYQMIFRDFEGSAEKSQLQTVTMEDGARFATSTTGGYYGFGYCKNLSSVRLPADLTIIPSGCFNGCISLASIDIPITVTEIGSDAFAGTALTSVTLPPNLVLLNGFKGCTGITSISIPASVTEIGSNAFCKCVGLTEITVPKNINKIGRLAFAECKNLKSITIENPSCEIYDEVETIYGSYDYDNTVGNYRYNWDGTIYGYVGSTAETYAIKYGWNFAVIGNSTTEHDTADTQQTLPLAPTGSYYGDVDGDGSITAADAQNVLMYYVDSLTGKTPSWKEITGNKNAPS